MPGSIGAGLFGKRKVPSGIGNWAYPRHWHSMPLLRLTIKGAYASFCNFFLRMLRKNWQKDFALDSRPRSTTLHSCPV